MSRTAVLIIIAATLFPAISALSQERKIERAQLPPAVQVAVAAQSQGATVRGFSEEKEKGQTYYEAELMVGGRSKDVLMDAQGNVVEVEEQVAIESLPAAVLDGLRAKAGNGRLDKVESITKHGKLVAYAARAIRDGKKSEIQVGPDGKARDHQE
jgi:hypothetical protein